MRIGALLLSASFLLPLSACVPKAKYDELSDQYDAAKRQNNQLQQQVAALQAREKAREKAYQDLVADLAPLIEKKVLKVGREGDRIVIGMAADVLFSSGSADLSADGGGTIAQLAQLLAKHAAEHDFQVEGHTDNEPIATAQFPNNWALGASRALTVTQRMIQAGFPARHLSAASFGEQHPVASNGTPEGRAQNRRIEVVLLPDLSEMPGGVPVEANRPGKPPGARRPKGPR